MTVLGHNGMLGSVVERRWRELGATGDYVICALAPDDLPLLRRLASRPGLIVPSTDAIAEATPYAAAKRQVEHLPAVVIRAGIVDIRKRPESAYRNWYSNPLTPLEWADLAYELRNEVGVHIAGREARSRYSITNLTAQVFGWSPSAPARADKALDRVQPADRERPPLRDALIAYRDWLGGKPYWT